MIGAGGGGGQSGEGVVLQCTTWEVSVGRGGDVGIGDCSNALPTSPEEATHAENSCLGVEKAIGGGSRPEAPKRVLSCLRRHKIDALHIFDHSDRSCG